MGSTVLLGIVAIGRNEGSRLERCLRSAASTGAPTVYVDSASSDGSAERAREAGVEVEELDPARPLSAARARNAGFHRLLALRPDLKLVQFIDGDCELVAGWLPAATTRLSGNARLAAVCGRRLERFPAASIYNQLIDLEWDTPVGPTRVFGGDVLMRTSVFLEVGGYDETLIAGEDPDLAARIADAGWAIERLASDMTVHDADLSRFGQWWKRQIRAGHAVVDAWLRAPWSDIGLRHRVASIAFWGGVLPLSIVAAFLCGAGLAGFTLLLAYPVLAARIYRRLRRNGRTSRESALYAGSCVEGKFAEFYGGLQCLSRRARRTTPRLIEYK